MVTDRVEALENPELVRVRAGTEQLHDNGECR